MWLNKDKYRRIKTDIKILSDEVLSYKKSLENLEVRIFEIDHPLKYKDGYAIDGNRTIMFGKVDPYYVSNEFYSTRHIRNNYYIRDHEQETNYWMAEQLIDEALEDIRIKDERSAINGS